MHSLLVAGLGLLAPSTPGAPDALLPLLDRAGRYVTRYEEGFKNALAEEVYTQKLTQLRHMPTVEEPAPESLFQKRTLRSDVAYVRLAGSIPWGTFRDTYEVDGKAVREREVRIERLLTESGDTPSDQARAFLSESSRYNLGRAFRNYNSPLVALLFLLPRNQSRFEFTLKGHGRVEATPVVEIAFEESGRPTLLRDLEDQSDLPASGRFWIEPQTGRVLRTLLNLRYRKTAEAEMEVDFRFVAKLKLLAPAQMRERWKDPMSRVEGDARYGNYRRFLTEVGPIRYAPN